MISAINAREQRVVFVLWGASARNRKRLIDTARHAVIEAAHPQTRPTARDTIKGTGPFTRSTS